MPPLMERITREVLEGKQRTKNRIREHSHHGWAVVREEGEIILLSCDCGWIGWMPKDI